MERLQVDNMSDVLQRIQEFGIGAAKEGNVRNTLSEDRPTIPIDGDIYATNAYLNTLSNKRDDFYIRYVDHLNYYTGLFALKGNEDVERLSPHFMRQLREFGKVAITKLNGKMHVLAVIHVEYNSDMTVKYAECITIRTGYSYTKDYKTVKLPGSKVVIIRSNYQAFPFIFMWRAPIEKIITLSDAALTGSIVSVKKIKRNLANNNSQVNKLETESMINAKHPYVNNITMPASYLTEIERTRTGDARGAEEAAGIMPNQIEFDNTGGDVKGQWDNLKSYIEFEYYQKGKRINTNKKNERNISAEIDTETINFEILDRNFLNWLLPGIREFNRKFNDNITIDVTTTADDNESDEEKEVQNA